MPRLGLLLLIVILSLATASPVAGQTPVGAATPFPPGECGTAPPDGLLLSQTGSQWTNEPELVVADGAGRELRRISFPQALFGVATGAPGKALYWVSEEEIVLVDAFTGTVTPLAIPPEAVRNMAPGPAPGWGQQGTGWWVLGGIMERHAYLINLETGDAYDVAAAIAAAGGELTQTMGAFVAPDNQHILIWTGDGLYLIAAAEPGTARALADGDPLAAPGYFRRGGAELVYSRSGAGNETEVAILDLARDEGEIIVLGGGLVAERRLMLLALPNPDEALLVWLYGPVDSPRSGTLETLDFVSGRTRFLIAPGSGVALPQLSPNGERLLFGTAARSTLVWQFVDLRTGAATVVADVSGTSGNLAGIGGRWSLFYPFTGTWSGTAGARYTGIELDTGRTTTLMTQRPEFEYSIPIVSGGDHRFALVTVSDDSRGGLVLLDLATGRSRTIAEGVTVSGAFSPDGCWVAAAVVDERGAGVIDLIPIAGGETLTLPDATLPVWVLPEPAE